jgi:signal peptidase I
MASTAGPPGAAKNAVAGTQGAGPSPARRHARTFAAWAITLLLALSLALGARAFEFQVFSIPSSSMEPTLDVGDRILVWKAFFNWHDVHQGEIVVFTHPPLDHCPGPADTDLVKRVIALPGQTIYSAGNTVYVNGRPLPEPYLPPGDRLGRQIPGATRQAPFHVPPGEFYVMGDNRQISCDSRYWGPIKGTSIVGEVVLLLWRGGHPDLHRL